MTNMFLIPLEQISEERKKKYENWCDLNQRLSREIPEFLSRVETSSFPIKISPDRFRNAVGIDGQQNRIGLVFKNAAQQEDFVRDFQNRMREHGYNSFSLVATGSSFQGLSTNPETYQKLGYMKFCGETKSTDLDLQIYCNKLLQGAIRAYLPVFREHFQIRNIEGIEYAKLTTFNNKDNLEQSAPYFLEPWIKDFERDWTKILKLNFHGTGVVFEGIAIALMTEPEFTQSNEIGSPYKLC